MLETSLRVDTANTGTFNLIELGTTCVRSILLFGIDKARLRSRHIYTMRIITFKFNIIKYSVDIPG